MVNFGFHWMRFHGLEGLWMLDAISSAGSRKSFFLFIDPVFKQIFFEQVIEFLFELEVRVGQFINTWTPSLPHPVTSETIPKPTRAQQSVTIMEVRRKSWMGKYRSANFFLRRSCHMTCFRLLCKEKPMNEYHLLGSLVCVGENFRGFAKSILRARKNSWRRFSPPQTKAWASRTICFGNESLEKIVNRGKFYLPTRNMKLSLRHSVLACKFHENRWPKKLMPMKY